jgi:DNA-binding transcriptional MocR family regulator
MTISEDDLRHRTGPRYRALADAIAAAIAEGRLARGAKLPPQRELAARLKITVGTVGRAYDLGVQRQQLTARVGRGTFVAEAEPGALVHDFIAAQDVPEFDPRHSTMDLRTNQPVSAGYGELARSVREAFAAGEPAAALLAYPPTAGHADDRAAGAQWLARHGVEARAEDVIVTAGAQGGLTMALSALARAGDGLLAASLSYPHFHDLAGLTGLRRHPVEVDDQGICPDALDAACRDTGAKLLLANLNLHNPTGAVMGEDRRRALAAVARRHDLWIVEDDVYALLLEQRPPALRSLAPERTVYVTSVSKTLAPGLRLGFLAAPRILHARLVDAQHTLLLGPPTPGAKLFRHWLESGLADRAVGFQREETSARHALARVVLGPLAPNTEGAGHHLWLRLPSRWRAGTLVDRLKAADVHVLPGDLFAYGRARVPHALRLSLSAAADRASLERALRLVRHTVEHDARGHEVVA